MARKRKGTETEMAGKSDEGRHLHKDERRQNELQQQKKKKKTVFFIPLFFHFLDSFMIFYFIYKNSIFL